MTSDRGSTTVLSCKDFMAFESSTQNTRALGTLYVVKIFAFEALSPAVGDGETSLVEAKLFIDDGSYTYSDVILRRLHRTQNGME